MHAATFTALETWVIAHGYVVFFFIALAEGPLVTMAAGAAAALGYFNIWIIIGLAFVGDAGADVVYYAIGHYSHHLLSSRVGRWLGLTEERLVRIKKLVHEHGRKAVLVIKLSPIGAIAIPGLVFLGMIRMPFKKFIESVLLVSVPKSIILALIGYFSLLAYVQLGAKAHTGYLLAGGIITAFFLYMAYTKITARIATEIEKE